MVDQIPPRLILLNFLAELPELVEEIFQLENLII